MFSHLVQVWDEEGWEVGKKDEILMPRRLEEYRKCVEVIAGWEFMEKDW